MTTEPKAKMPTPEPEQKKRKRKEPPPPRYAPNIIPLIDVLFMLLLYFLLSTRFRQMEGDIAGSLPSSGGEPAAVDAKQLTIKVRASDANDSDAIFEVNQSPTAIGSAEQLFEALRTYQKDFGPDAPVLIEPVGDVRWRFVVEAFNQAYRARFTKIGFFAQG